MIQDDLIAFNKQGKVKVWINSDFASNEPEITAKERNIFSDSGRDESFMLDCVTEVLRTVGNRSIAVYPHDFR